MKNFTDSDCVEVLVTRTIPCNEGPPARSKIASEDAGTWRVVWLDLPVPRGSSHDVRSISPGIG